MRVITGSARGKRLLAPEGEAVRPTSDMAKGAMFSIIQFEVENTCVLDLFAGSGQLGIEAMSRGARKAVFVDSSRESVEYVRKNLKDTGFTENTQAVCTDALSFLKGTKETFDIAFLDPPYQKGILPEVLPYVEGKMKRGGVIICETEKGETLPDGIGKYTRKKEYKYGKCKLTVYREGEAG